MANDTPRFDGRMGDAEALMWRLEQDRRLSPTFAVVSILDRPPDLGVLRERMRRVSLAVPRLRQRVESPPGGIGAPAWVDDPEFDVRWHVRRIALAPPGDLHQLQELAALIASDPFDRSRPLWQFTVVEGLVDGRCALIQKLHHSLADGEASVALSMQILDAERVPPEPPRSRGGDDADPARAGGDATGGDDASDRPGDPTTDLLADLLRGPLDALRQVRDLVADPSATAGQQVAALLQALAAELGDPGAARSPLWTGRSLRRRMEVLSIPYDGMRGACSALGGTLNAGFLTVVAHAAGRYHDRLGAPTESLRASMAVSTRSEDSGGNAFTLARLLVPTAEMPLAERFAAVAESLAAVRDRRHEDGLRTLTRVSGVVPTSLLTRVARAQGQAVDLATSNLRGPAAPRFVAGSRILAAYPLGPTGGAAVNVTMLGYDQRLGIGVHLDEEAVAEPALLMECLGDAAAELCGCTPAARAEGRATRRLRWWRSRSR